jgi:hypothetical protein
MSDPLIQSAKKCFREAASYPTAGWRRGTRAAASSLESSRRLAGFSRIRNDVPVAEFNSWGFRPVCPSGSVWLQASQ